MHPRTLAVVSLIAAVTFTTPGCSRMVSSALRSSRSRGSQNQTKPEDMRFTFVWADAAAKKKLDGYRATYAQYVEKYGAGELTGAKQVAAVVDAINNAHWSERPKTEDCLRPIGVAIGDVLARDAGVNWGLGHGTLLCLFSTNGKVLVAPVDIAETWLTNKNHPINELVTEVKDAIRNTTGEPIEIGSKPGIDESDEDMI